MPNPSWHANELEKEIKQQENAIINQQTEQALQEKAETLLGTSACGIAKCNHGIPNIAIAYRQAIGNSIENRQSKIVVRWVQQQQ